MKIILNILQLSTGITINLQTIWYVSQIFRTILLPSIQWLHYVTMASCYSGIFIFACGSFQGPMPLKMSIYIFFLLCKKHNDLPKTYKFTHRFIDIYLNDVTYDLVFYQKRHAKASNFVILTKKNGVFVQKLGFVN